MSVQFIAGIKKRKRHRQGTWSTPSLPVKISTSFHTSSMLAFVEDMGDRSVRAKMVIEVFSLVDRPG